MKKITNSFKQVVDPAVPRGSIYLIGGSRHKYAKLNLNYIEAVVPPDPFPYTQSELDMYADLRRKIDEEVKLISQRVRNSWLYFPDDRIEVERICNGIDMGVRPARSTLDNWQYKCLTDNGRASMGLGEN